MGRINMPSFTTRGWIESEDLIPTSWRRTSQPPAVLAVITGHYERATSVGFVMHYYLPTAFSYLLAVIPSVRAAAVKLKCYHRVETSGWGLMMRP